MNRTLLLVAIAAIAIVGIGVGLLLPALQGGPLTGSILPISTFPTMMTMRTMPTPTPTPVPPVSITITGTYSPYRFVHEDLQLYDWHWNLQA